MNREDYELPIPSAWRGTPYGEGASSGSAAWFELNTGDRPDAMRPGDGTALGRVKKGGAILVEIITAARYVALSGRWQPARQKVDAYPCPHCGNDYHISVEMHGRCPDCGLNRREEPDSS